MKKILLFLTLIASLTAQTVFQNVQQASGTYTDNSIVRRDGTTNKVQNSVLIVADTTGALSGFGAGAGVTFSGGGSIVGTSGAITVAASGTNQNINITPSGTGSVVLSNGTATNPGLSFVGNTGTTGFYWAGPGVVGYASTGAASLSFNAGGIMAGTSSNSITLNSSGAVALAAGGTNQNITLTPSGTGATSLASGDLYMGSGVYVTPRRQSGNNLVQSYGFSGDNLQVVGSNIAGSYIAFSNTGINAAQMALHQSGNLTIGTTTDSSNGRLQLATHTTSAGGIGFGTDTAFYRSAAGQILTDSAGVNVLVGLSLGGTRKTYYFFDGTNTQFSAETGSLILKSADTTALTLDTSQNATFAGAIIGTVQALSGAGAVNVTQLTTAYTSTGGAEALTLANGTAGQIKTIIHVVDGGSGVLTPTTKIGFTTITFTNVGDSVTLQYTAQGWAIIGIFGAVAA